MVLNIFKTKTENDEDLNIAENLTSEQRKTYRKQYISVMITALFYTFMTVGAIIETIKIIFEFKDVFFIGVGFIVLILREYLNSMLEQKEEIELIKERIEKRSKKNKKNLNLEQEKDGNL